MSNIKASELNIPLFSKEPFSPIRQKDHLIGSETTSHNKKLTLKEDFINFHSGFKQTYNMSTLSPTKDDVIREETVPRILES